MRRGFGLIGLVVTAILLTIVGVIAYNIGWSDGVATHLPAGTAAAPPYYYGYGPQWGFGIFGFFWFLFVLFILFGLLQVRVLRTQALGRRRMGLPGRPWIRSSPGHRRADAGVAQAGARRAASCFEHAPAAA